MKMNNHVNAVGKSRPFARFLASVCLCSMAFASNAVNVDSLRSLLSKEFGPKRQKILFDLAYHFTDVDNRLAMNYINQAIKFNEIYGDSLLIVKCGRIKALLYRRFDEMDSSLWLSERILGIAERNKYDFEWRRILDGMAMVYSFTCKFDKALICYDKILSVLDPDENKAEGSTIFNNIGIVYLQLDDIEKALFYFKKSLTLKEEAMYRFDLDKVLANISACYAHSHNFPEAEEFNRKALIACGENCSKGLIARVECNRGLILFGKKKFIDAAKYFRKSHELAKEAKNSRLQLETLFLELKVYNEANDFASARTVLPAAEMFANSNSFYKYGVLELCKQLAIAYEKMHDIRKVAYYQARYIHLKDSVITDDLTKNLMRVEAEFLERENREKLKAQGRVLELRNDIIARQKTLNIVTGGVTILLIAFLILLIQNIRQKKRINDLLEDKVRERTLELENKHNLLLKSVKERDLQVQRISNDIRSSLATIKGLGVLVSHDWGSTSATNYLAKIEETSNTLIQGLNRVHDKSS